MIKIEQVERVENREATFTIEILKRILRLRKFEHLASLLSVLIPREITRD